MVQQTVISPEDRARIRQAVSSGTRLAPEERESFRGLPGSTPTGFGQQPEQEQQLNLFQRGLESFNRNIVQRWGSIIADPFTPSTPGTEGMGFFDRAMAEGWLNCTR